MKTLYLTMEDLIQKYVDQRPDIKHFSVDKTRSILQLKKSDTEIEEISIITVVNEMRSQAQSQGFVLEIIDAGISCKIYAEELDDRGFWLFYIDKAYENKTFVAEEFFMVLKHEAQANGVHLSDAHSFDFETYFYELYNNTEKLKN